MLKFVNYKNPKEYDFIHRTEIYYKNKKKAYLGAWGAFVRATKWVQPSESLNAILSYLGEEFYKLDQSKLSSTERLEEAAKLARDHQILVWDEEAWEVIVTADDLYEAFQKGVKIACQLYNDSPQHKEDFPSRNYKLHVNLPLKEKPEVVHAIGRDIRAYLIELISKPSIIINAKIIHALSMDPKEIPQLFASNSMGSRLINAAHIVIYLTEEGKVEELADIISHINKIAATHGINSMPTPHNDSFLVEGVVTLRQDHFKVTAEDKELPKEYIGKYVYFRDFKVSPERFQEQEKLPILSELRKLFAERVREEAAPALAGAEPEAGTEPKAKRQRIGLFEEGKQEEPIQALAPPDFQLQVGLGKNFAN